LHFFNLQADCSITRHVRFATKCLIAIFAQNAMWLGAYDLLENYKQGGSNGYWREFTWTFGGLWLMHATETFIAASWLVFPEGEVEAEAEADDDSDNDATRDGAESDGSQRRLSIDSNPSIPSTTVERAASNNNVGNVEAFGGELEPIDPPVKFYERIFAPPSGTWAFQLRMSLSYIGAIAHNTGMWTLFDIYLPYHEGRPFIYIAVGIFGLWLTGGVLANFGVAYYPDEISEQERAQLCRAWLPCCAREQHGSHNPGRLPTDDDVALLEI
jgi:hypothetical protein